MDNYDIRKVAEWMVKEGYFIIYRGRYMVSEKFNTEVRGVKEGIRVLPNKKIAVREQNRPAPGLTPEEWRDRYMQFIVDCKVPRYGRMSDGRTYELNKFSEIGLKKFRELIENENVDVERLTAVTAGYYADRRIMHLTIGNYIITGAWRTEYAQLTPRDDYDQFQIG